MKNSYLLISAIGLFVATPAVAQSSSVSSAVKGTMTQTPIQPQPLYIPPPAPPPAPPPPPRLRVPDNPREDLREAPPPRMMVAPVVPYPYPEYPTKPVIINYPDALPKPADYPVESWKNGEEGPVEISVEVDATGQPTGCTVTQTSGFPALDAKTCVVVMERAEFKPAMEAEGKPVAGTMLRTYNWRKTQPEMPPMSVTYEYLHDEGGKTKDCKILKLEGDVPEAMRRDMERNMERNGGCPTGPRQSGIPYRDENGVPVAKRVTVTFEVKVEEPVE